LLTGRPPVEAGGIHVSLTPPDKATASSFVTCCGRPRGVCGAVAAENAPVPTRFTAATRKTYVTPFVRFDTVKVLVAGTPVRVFQLVPPFELHWTV
jgi:hypothetical protein